MKEEQSKPLTPKQQKFAELCVELGNQTEAYRQAYDVTDKDAEWIKVKASQMASQDNISLTIEKIKESLRLEKKIDREYVLEKHMQIIEWYLELKEKASKKDITKEEKSIIYMLKDLIKGSDYRGSLDSITKMLGLNEPEKREDTIRQIIIEEKKRDEE